MKLAANFMLGAAVETLGEAATLVTGHGLAMQDFLDVITSGLFPGPVYSGYGKMIAEQRYEPALFKARLGLEGHAPRAGRRRSGRLRRCRLRAWCATA